MWNGLFFGLASLFTPHTGLPDSAAVQEEIRQFAQIYEIDILRINVLQSTLDHPSPFLTNGGIKSCLLRVNQNNNAKRVWSHFVDSGHEGAEPAFLAFTLGHELTHCMLSEKGRRVIAKTALQEHLGREFKTNVHFEETLADLVGLAYVQKVAAQHYEVVHQRVKTIRTDFSVRDPEHNSVQALDEQNVAFANQMFLKIRSLRFVEAGVK